MKLAHTYRAATAFFLIYGVIFNFASASEANIPHTFSAGTPARAEEVNDNFNAVKAAVDDNHARISDNAGEIAANSSAISKMQEQQSHVYIVNPASVNVSDETGLVVGLYGIQTSARRDNLVFAPVNLPQGAIVTDMDCLVIDNANGPDFSGGYIRLERRRVEEGPVQIMPDVLVDIPLETTGNSQTYQRLVDEDGVVEHTEIDNLLYDYAVKYYIVRSEIAMSLVVSRCRITYQH